MHDNMPSPFPLGYLIVPILMALTIIFGLYAYMRGRSIIESDDARGRYGIESAAPEDSEPPAAPFAESRPDREGPSTVW